MSNSEHNPMRENVSTGQTTTDIPKWFHDHPDKVEPDDPTVTGIKRNKHIQMQKCKAILNFISENKGCVKRAHLDNIFFFPINRCVQYLIQNKRLYKIGDDCLALNRNMKSDFKYLTSLTVLCDLFRRGKINEYSEAEYPAQICFTTGDSAFCEIIYVQQGDEAEVRSRINPNLKQEGEAPPDPLLVTKHIFVVEHLNQAEKLSSLGDLRLALVHQDGTVSYHTKKVGV